VKVDTAAYQIPSRSSFLHRGNLTHTPKDAPEGALDGFAQLAEIEKRIAKRNLTSSVGSRVISRERRTREINLKSKPKRRKRLSRSESQETHANPNPNPGGKD